MAFPPPDAMFYWNGAHSGRHHAHIFPNSGSTFGVGTMPTASRTVADTVAGSHQHTLAGFHLAHSLGVGARACSDYFTVGGLRCRLEVFPGGCTPEHQGHVSVFITSPDAYASGQLFLHEVSVVDATTGKAHVTAGRGQTSGPRPADAWGVVASHPRLCKTDEAFARLHHDSLTIRVTVQALRSWSHGVSTHMPYAYNPAFPPPHLLYAAAPPPPVLAPGAGLPPIYMG